MNIDFIKFLVGYAEGFEWYEKDDTLEYQDIFGCYLSDLNTEHWLLNYGIFWNKIYYPLLLQRAIEGINLSKSEYEVDLINGLVEVCKEEYSAREWLPTTEGITYDQAKEQALKYIYEQELSK